MALKLPENDSRRFGPELNSIKDYMTRLTASHNAIADKLQTGEKLPEDSPLYELLYRLCELFGILFSRKSPETFLTKLNEQLTLPGSYQALAGENITFDYNDIKQTLRINSTGGGSEQQWPIIDRLDWVREYEDFVSGGGFYTDNSLYQPFAYPFDSRSRLNFSNLMFTEDFKAGSSSLPDPANADLFHGIGARNGVIERLAASDASFNYPEGGGIELSGGSVSGDVIEYQSAQDDRVTITGWTDGGRFDIFWQMYIPIANNASYPQFPPFPDIPAITGEFIVRVGLTGDAILSGDPPLDGIYLEKTSGNLETDAKWWAVVRAAGAETRSTVPVQFFTNGPAQVRIRSYYDATYPVYGFNVQGVSAPSNQQEVFVSSVNVPLIPMNIFLQIIPMDAALDTRVKIIKYDVDMSPAVNGAPIPGWSVAPVGKGGWAAGFVDVRLFYYTQCGYVTYARGAYPGLTSYVPHPGILQLIGGFDPNDIRTNDYDSVDPPFFLDGFQFATASTLFTPWNNDTAVNMGCQFEPWDGLWLQRFIIHVGASDFDAEDVPATIIGLAIEGSIPFPPLVSLGLAVSGTICFYHGDIALDPNWHIYFDMGTVPVDEDTGIPVWDALDTPQSPWFIMDFEKVSADSDDWTATLRDETGGALFTIDVTPDTGTFDTYSMGPFASIQSNAEGPQTTTGLLFDAWGYKHDLAGRGTEVFA